MIVKSLYTRILHAPVTQALTEIVVQIVEVIPSLSL